MTLTWNDLSPDEQQEALRYTEARRVAEQEREQIRAAIGFRDALMAALEDTP